MIKLMVLLELYLEDPFDIFKGKKKGDIVTAKVAEILDNLYKSECG